MRIVKSPLWQAIFCCRSTADGSAAAVFIGSGKEVCVSFVKAWTMMLIGLASLGFVACRRQKQNGGLTTA